MLRGLMPAVLTTELLWNNWKTSYNSYSIYIQNIFCDILVCILNFIASYDYCLNFCINVYFLYIVSIYTIKPIQGASEVTDKFSEFNFKQFEVLKSCAWL